MRSDLSRQSYSSSYNEILFIFIVCKRNAHNLYRKLVQIFCIERATTDSHLICKPVVFNVCFIRTAVRYGKECPAQICFAQTHMYIYIKTTVGGLLAICVVHQTVCRQNIYLNEKHPVCHLLVSTGNVPPVHWSSLYLRRRTFSSAPSHSFMVAKHIYSLCLSLT